MGNGFYDWWGGNQNDFMKLNPQLQNTIGGRYNDSLAGSGSKIGGAGGAAGQAGLFTGADGAFSGTNTLGTIGQIAGLAQGLFGEGGLFGGSRQLDAMEKSLDEQIAANKRGFNANATKHNNQVRRGRGWGAESGYKHSAKEIATV